VVDLKVTTLTGREGVLQESIVEEFKKSLRGQLLCLGDEGYNEARKIWNCNIDKRPAIIARCAGVADVIDCVDFARANNILVSVRGGGHNIPGNCLCNGGLVIDLSLMRSVRVDPLKRTARAEGGTKWGDFDHETQAFALATTGGVISHTGIAGLTLGGGIGWLSGHYGLACDNLVSVDIVTADGKFRTVSATEEPDLFWAVRGGGGNFGVVTSFEYQLHPVGPIVLAGVAFYPFLKAKEFLRLYSDFSTNIPNALNTAAGLGTSSDGHKVGFIAICYHGSIQEGERVLKPVREFGPPLADHIQPMPYTVAQTMLNSLAPSGRHYYIKAHFMRDIRDDAIDTMLAHFAKVTSPLSLTLFQQLGNAVNRMASDATAFGHRDALYSWEVVSAWEDPGESEVHIRWAREFSEAMLPFTRGFYVNHVGTEAEEGTDRIRAAYGVSYQTLVALKNRYDPTNFFSHNQNIKPTV